MASATSALRIREFQPLRFQGSHISDECILIAGSTAEQSQPLIASWRQPHLAHYSLALHTVGQPLAGDTLQSVMPSLGELETGAHR